MRTKSSSRATIAVAPTLAYYAVSTRILDLNLVHIKEVESLALYVYPRISCKILHEMRRAVDSVGYTLAAGASDRVDVRESKAPRLAAEP